MVTATLPAGVTAEQYPFTGHYFTLPHGAKMHYIDQGQGSPVVMVHGNPSWSFYYRNLAQRLSDQHRVIVPDHIGCGLSDKPEDAQYDYTLGNRVQDLELLLNSLNLTEKITLVVHDWGGMIGMTYATRYPEKIAKLVILNTAAFFLPDGKTFPYPLRLSRTPLGALLIRGANAFAGGAAWVGCKRNKMHPNLRRAYTAPYNNWKNRIATLRFVEDIPLKQGDKAYAIVQQTQDKLSELSHVPMLICWGLLDFVFDHHFLKEWQRRFPNAQVHAYPDCGHYILEDAQQEVLPLIEKFVNHA